MAKSPKELPKAILKQMATLAMSGFSLVTALAWNDLIKAFIEEYIKPYTAKGSGIIAQLIYAVAVTVLVVLITFQLTWIQEKFQRTDAKKVTEAPKKKKRN